MNAEPQTVLDYRGDHTIFLVYNFNKDQEVGPAFQRICAYALHACITRTCIRTMLEEAGVSQ